MLPQVVEHDYQPFLFENNVEYAYAHFAYQSIILLNSMKWPELKKISSENGFLKFFCVYDYMLRVVAMCITANKKAKCVFWQSIILSTDEYAELSRICQLSLSMEDRTQTWNKKKCLINKNNESSTLIAYFLPQST